MINKKENRLRRAGATRARIKLQKVNRLTVHRTNLHIYASIISASGDRVLVSASTAEAEVRAAAISPLLRSSAPVWLRRRRLPESNPALSTVPVIVTTAALPRWPRPRAKPVSSSKD